MKQFLFFILFTFLSFQLSGQYQSQTTTEGTSFPDYVDYVFEHMDLTQVPTGILKEKATPMTNLFRYDGTAGVYVIEILDLINGEKNQRKVVVQP